jgi:hypothetical protein
VRLQEAVALYSSSNNNSNCVTTEHANSDVHSCGHRYDAVANSSNSNTTTEMLLSSSSTHSRRSRKAHHKSINGSITDHEQHEASTELKDEYDTLWHEERLAHLQVITTDWFETHTAYMLDSMAITILVHNDTAVQYKHDNTCLPSSTGLSS